jgi:hypothetical protein
MNVNDYIKPELLVLVPVMYLIGMGCKKSALIADNYIPLVLGAVSVLLSGVWVLATSPVGSFQEVCTAVFTAVTQGILAAGASVYCNQVIKQAQKEA